MSVETKLPQWAIDTLHAKNLGFETPPLIQKLWNAFLTEFDPNIFNENDLPHYFPQYVEHLKKTGWIKQTKSSITTQSKTKKTQQPKLSAIEVLEYKIENFLQTQTQTQTQTQQGKVIKATIIVECPSCLHHNIISRESLIQGSTLCKKCNQRFIF